MWASQLALLTGVAHAGSSLSMHSHVVQVLLTSQLRAKLADTGLAVVLSSCSHRTVSACGTYPYTSPEVLMGEQAALQSALQSAGPAPTICSMQAHDAATRVIPGLSACSFTSWWAACYCCEAF